MGKKRLRINYGVWVSRWCLWLVWNGLIRWWWIWVWWFVCVWNWNVCFVCYKMDVLLLLIIVGCFIWVKNWNRCCWSVLVIFCYYSMKMKYCWCSVCWVDCGVVYIVFCSLLMKKVCGSGWCNGRLLLIIWCNWLCFGIFLVIFI